MEHNKPGIHQSGMVRGERGMMPDRETVITHLQIINIWAKFARERDLQFFTPKHLEDIAEWSADAIALLKEQDELLHKKEKDIDKLCVEISRLKHQIHDNEPTFDDWYCADGEKRNDLE